MPTGILPVFYSVVKEQMFFLFLDCQNAHFFDEIFGG